MIRREENNPKSRTEQALSPRWNDLLKVVEAPGSSVPAALHRHIYVEQRGFK